MFGAVLARDLDYELPEALIAQEPLPERSASRLLVVTPQEARFEHRSIRELPQLLRPALWVVNESRVLPARMHFLKPTGGRVEVLLVERVHGEDRLERWIALARGTKSLREGMTLAHEADASLSLELLRKREDGDLEIALRVPQGTVMSAIERLGRMPLPPYVRREADERDAERYQTVFAREAGSVAAPTAGLHFDAQTIAALEGVGHRFTRVALHVGPGTFAPLRSEDLSEHVMHEERYLVPPAAAREIEEAKAAGLPIVAVGTTVVRTLESAALAAEPGALLRAGEGRTRLFVRPPFEFRVIDALLTNFHLPRSTLLALVMALAGAQTTRDAYAAAIAERYRFFSYGDAMLIRSADLSLSQGRS